MSCGVGPPTLEEEQKHTCLYKEEEQSAVGQKGVKRNVTKEMREVMFHLWMHW